MMILDFSEAILVESMLLFSHWFLFSCRYHDEQISKLSHLSEKLDKFSDLAEKWDILTDMAEKMEKFVDSAEMVNTWTKLTETLEKVANLSENIQKLMPNNSDQSSDKHAVEGSEDNEEPGDEVDNEIEEVDGTEDCISHI